MNKTKRLLFISVAVIFFLAALIVAALLMFPHYLEAKYERKIAGLSQQDRPFNLEDWNRRDAHYHDRKYVVKDLMEFHLPQGKQYEEVKELLGEGRKYYVADSTVFVLSYEIEVLYKWPDIDPYQSIYLSIYFSATDSLLIHSEFR